MKAALRFLRAKKHLGLMFTPSLDNSKYVDFLGDHFIFFFRDNTLLKGSGEALLSIWKSNTNGSSKQVGTRGSPVEKTLENTSMEEKKEANFAGINRPQVTTNSHLPQEYNSPAKLSGVFTVKSPSSPFQNL